MGWFKFFRSGKHTASNGIEREFTNEDLDRIVQLYSESKVTDKAPIVIGHPKLDDPAYGWIGDIRRNGDDLEALPEDVDPKFAEEVNQGRYRKVSAAFYPDLRLRHIGFLGAARPAIKGLPEVKFSEADMSQILAFSETGEIQSVEVTEIKTSADNAETNTAQASNVEASSAADNSTTTDKATAADNTQASQGQAAAKTTGSKPELSYAEVSAELEKAQQEKKKAEEELQRLYMQNRLNDFLIFINEKIAYCNMLPKQKDAAMKIFEALNSINFSSETKSNSYEFSDKTTADPVELFKGYLTAQPKLVEFREFTGEDNKEPVEKPQTGKSSPSDIIADSIRKSSVKS